MKAPGSVIALAIGLVMLLVPATAARQQAPQTQPGPVFRTGTTIVPVDVRVVDKQNRPVTDLKQSDFTITENGVPQEIVVFTTHTAVPEAAVVPGLIRRRDDVVDPVAPRSYRVFLLVLGRGRLNGVKNSLNGLEHFVRDSLHPQDYVAVMAYNRTTDFTTDHGAILEILQRYRKTNLILEANRIFLESGLRALYGSTDPPKSEDGALDRLFGDARALGVRRIVPPAAGAAPQTPAQWKAVDALMECDRSGSKLDCAMAERRVSGLLPTPVGSTDRRSSTAPNLDLFLGLSIRHLQDASSIYAGIEALRRLDGEKHLIYLTPQGMYFSDERVAKQLARVASDARVAIDIIHTDGMTSYTAVEQGVQLTRMTGGRFDINRNRWAAKDLDLINQDTMFKYVIGYKPARPEWDGTFREVKVTVNRKDVKIANRQGYFARDLAASPALRSATTYSRIAGAAQQLREVGDIAMSIRATASDVTRKVTFHLAVDISRLTFERSEAGLNTASLDLALFCLDSKQRNIGQIWQTATLELNDVGRRELERRGAQIQIPVQTTGVISSAKVVVYEYAGDIVGSRNISFPKPAKK